MAPRTPPPSCDCVQHIVGSHCTVAPNLYILQGIRTFPILLDPPPHQKGKRGVHGPPTRAPLSGGGARMGGSFNITSVPFLRQYTLNILHCIALTQTKGLRKEINYVLIHNNTFQSLVWSSVALIINVSHFENWLLLFVVSLLQKRWRNEGFKVTSELPLYKFKVTWNYACIPLSIITSSNKNTFKSHNCP